MLPILELVVLARGVLSFLKKLKVVLQVLYVENLM